MGPYIESALGHIHIHPAALSPPDKHVPSLLVSGHELLHAILHGASGFSGGALYRPEEAEIDITLGLLERAYDVRVTVDHAYPPTGHIVRLRQRMELDAFVLSPFDLGAIPGAATVKYKMPISVIVGDNYILIFRPIHHLGGKPVAPRQ